jgi:uncharacterized membrane protein
MHVQRIYRNLLPSKKIEIIKYMNPIDNWSHPRRSSNYFIGSWSRASPITLTLLFFFCGHFTVSFSLFSYSVMLCFYFVMCLCCFLLNPICLGFGLFVSEVVLFSSFFFSFGFFLKTFFFSHYYCASKSL